MDKDKIEMIRGLFNPSSVKDYGGSFKTSDLNELCDMALGLKAEIALSDELAGQLEVAIYVTDERDKPQTTRNFEKALAKHKKARS